MKTNCKASLTCRSFTAGDLLRTYLWKKTYMTVATLFVIGISIPIFSYILSSLATGIVIGALQIPILANKVRQPDFTKGIFLDILLKDGKITKKINNNIVRLMISTAIMQGLVLYQLVGSSSYILLQLWNRACWASIHMR